MTAPPTPATVDLTNCDREPIHVPGAIQPHGVLLVLGEPGLEVRQASANAAAFCGVPVDDLAGQPLEALLPPLVPLVREAVADGPLDRPVPLGGPLAAGTPARPVDALLHRTDAGLVLELEFRTSTGEAPVPLQRALERLQGVRGVQALCDVAVREVRRLTGFDRVKLYRFDPDWHGEVIAEDRAAHMDAYLGLRFPASDIPQQARRLYTLNRLRIIPDAGYAPVPVVPAVSPVTGAPLDLSFSTLRSVSPVHVEYLKNMGVEASMSISILQEGRLWGMFACHHARPWRVPYRVRAACDLLGHVLGLLLATTQEGEGRQQQAARRERQARLLQAMIHADDFVAGLAEAADDLLGLVGAQGAAVVGPDRCLRLGQAPDDAALRDLTAWLEAEGHTEVFHTDRLPRLYPAAPADVASGLLATSLSRLERHYVLWFRPEVPRTVYWAGDPAKAVSGGAAGAPGEPVRLHPRTSFRAWQDTLRGQSLPWHPAEVEAARELRRAISDVVLVRVEKLARLNASLAAANASLGQANRWLQQRNRELQEFAYVASHDLQEPLRKIRSFSSLLQDEYGPQLGEQGGHYVDRMSHAAARMSALIADLLGFSRVVTHAGPFKEVDLGRVAEWVVRELDDSLAEAGARVEVGALPRVEADLEQMRQLFLNLVSNAVKFRRPGAPPLIRIDAASTEGVQLPGVEGPVYRITVADNGMGFDEKYLDRIFFPFQRLHGRDEYEGTGIGLAVCKRIVERHGGTITAESTPGEGATFVVTLPEHPPRIDPSGDPEAA